jgi:HPt (histidine-containing phosphotransfer) domain-containing protein
MFIDVIDTQKGIAYMAGKKEIYIKIAGKFASSLEAKTEELKQFFENRDYDRLTIEFHGMKSSSASVGSTVLPKIALELEMAGKANDKQLVDEKFEQFLEQYKDTCGAIIETIAGL